MGWVCEYPPFLYMKQHITKRQWDELSFEQRNTFCIKTKYVGEITIGQMIEFLGDLVPIIEPHEYWRVMINKNTEPDANEITFEEDELADALWLAVKYKLNS